MFEKDCHYIFTSYADAKIHRTLAHGTTRTTRTTKKSDSAGSVSRNSKKQQKMAINNWQRM